MEDKPALRILAPCKSRRPLHDSVVTLKANRTYRVPPRCCGRDGDPEPQDLITPSVDKGVEA